MSATHHRPAPERGFALVSAIFLVVALAALGVYMARIASVQHANALQDLQGSAAYQAARSGVEWGAYQITQERAANAGTGNFAANCRSGVAAVSLPVLSGFVVAVSCEQSGPVASEGASILRFYKIIATATSAGMAPEQSGYVARQLEIRIEQPDPAAS